jgi:hypothetical protein
MLPRQFGLYFSWGRPSEIGAELGSLDNRFPTLYEFRRILWPEFEMLADAARFSQGIDGFIDDVILADFRHFREVVQTETGHDVRVIQREGAKPPCGQLDDRLLSGIDTLIIVSLDHVRSAQQATDAEIILMREFLATTDHTLVVCPHHDVGNVGNLSPERRLAAQEVEYRHHGDPTIPPEQRFSGFARSLLEGLGVPVINRFGLNPARTAAGLPTPIEVDRAVDYSSLLDGVSTFNLHPHLPQLEIAPASAGKLKVLARQPINVTAPPHPFVAAGNHSFNALVQAEPGIFAGRLLVCDATLWSSAFGGLDSLQRFWTNVARVPRS